jgi:co-chaperonin GroES (HSP10)
MPATHPINLKPTLQLSNESEETKPSLSPTTKFKVGELSFWALGDRVLIEEDQFRSGYECEQCSGLGKVPCLDCEGIQTKSNGKKCSICDEGRVRCPSCNGKGGLIVTPETAQRRPTSGVVVSAGQDCKTLKPGDTVLFSNFAGYLVDLNRAGQPIAIRILHESEILAGMDGHLTLSNLRGKSEIAAFNP